MVEARVVQSGDAEVRLVQCVAPGPDPLFPVAIVMPITRDGRWRKYEDRGGPARLRRPSPADAESERQWRQTTLLTIVASLCLLVHFVGLFGRNR